MTRTGFVYHEDCLAHRNGSGHPESPERVRAIREELRRSGLVAELDCLEPDEITDALIEAVHTPAHIARVVGASQTEATQLDPDTRAGHGSDRAARLAAGGVIQSVDRVMNGSWRNAFVACRPPGHHAERARAMGFCLYNHAAIAAAYLREHHGLERVAVVDWDVHHGNGTQHLFESDPTVFYASLHQFPHYPGTGAASERGLGDGEGATLNCPLPAGSGTPEWLAAFESQVLPALEEFRPEFVIVSAGFDGHRDDPLSGCLLDEDSFRRMTRRISELANSCAGGRVVSLLEGGYDLAALGRSAAAHAEELHGAPQHGAPQYGTSQQPSPQPTAPRRSAPQ